MGMRKHVAAAGSLIAIGIALMAPSAGAALSVPCCPPTISNAPCTTLVYNTSEGAPSVGLRSLLTPLRRPQTPPDLPPRRFPESSDISLGEDLGLGEGVRTGSIRRAAVIHGASLYLVPVARACDHGYPVREAVFLLTVQLHGSSTSGPGTVASIKRQGIQATWGWRAEGNTGVEEVPGVVPQGVAKVTLLYPHGPSGRGFSRSVTVPVVNNVYDALVPYIPIATRESPEPPRRTVWRSRSGKILRIFPS
jgi:hypothetical protein